MGGSLAPISGVGHHHVWPGLWIWKFHQCRLHTIFGCRDTHVRHVLNITRPQHTLVTPADYVELRALALARQEIEVRVEPPPGFEPGSRILRLWPFRWPAHEPQALTPEPTPEPQPEVGHYIDILF